MSGLRVRSDVDSVAQPPRLARAWMWGEKPRSDRAVWITVTIPGRTGSSQPAAASAISATVCHAAWLSLPRSSRWWRKYGRRSLGTVKSFGFLDRYFEAIFEIGFSDTEWTLVDTLVHQGTTNRSSGFTAHPRYLEVAEAYGLFELWDERGAPDHCEKLDGQWVCE